MYLHAASPCLGFLAPMIPLSSTVPVPAGLGSGTLHPIRFLSAQASTDGPLGIARDAGKPSRFAYVSTYRADKESMFSGIAKYDLQAPAGKAVVGQLTHGPHHGGGEAFFVPSHTDPQQLQGTANSGMPSFDALSLVMSPVAASPIKAEHVPQREVGCTSTMNASQPWSAPLSKCH